MLKVKEGATLKRKVVITGTDEELNALARAIDEKLVWSRVEEQYDEIPGGFFEALHDALNGDLED